MNTALVTGATGAVGPALVRRLQAEGYNVRILTRRAPPPGLFGGAITIYTGDITERAAVTRAVAGCDVVFHLAAKLHVNSPGVDLRAEYERVNVGGTSVITQTAATSGVARVVFFSTIAVYGNSKPDQILTEADEPRADSLYAQTKLEAEQIVLNTRAHDGAPIGVVLRLAAVYGPRIRGNYNLLVRMIRSGFVVQVGAGRNRRTLVYDDDVATAALLAARHPAGRGQIFNLTDGSVHTLADIVHAIAAALERRPVVVAVPTRAARTLAGLGDGVLALARRRRVMRSLVDKLVEDLAVSGQGIQRVLGFKPAMNLTAGWQAALNG